MTPRLRCVVSCEHGGSRVPAAFHDLFQGHEALLESHRGFDLGSLELGKMIAERLGAPFVATTVTRLLVDTNRSVGHRTLFSEISGQLSEVEKDAVLSRFYKPHRRRIEEAVAREIAWGQVLHLGVHSFTPVLNGVQRAFDIGWLYDSKKRQERLVADRLITALHHRRGDLRQRRNAPYLGNADGLTTTLRRRFSEDAYLGIELEVNQLLPQGPTERWRSLVDNLCTSLEQIVMEPREAARDSQPRP